MFISCLYYTHIFLKITAEFVRGWDSLHFAVIFISDLLIDRIF